jgi:hypothetical protein
VLFLIPLLDQKKDQPHQDSRHKLRQANHGLLTTFGNPTRRRQQKTTNHTENEDRKFQEQSPSFLGVFKPTLGSDIG